MPVVSDRWHHLLGNQCYAVSVVVNAACCGYLLSQNIAADCKELPGYSVTGAYLAKHCFCQRNELLIINAVLFEPKLIAT